jgi:restriction system protein
VDTAFRFLATGAVFVIVALALRESSLAKGFPAIVPVGLFVLFIGALLFVPGSRRKRRPAPAMAHGEYVPTLLTRLEVPEEDLVTAQFELAGDELKAARSGRAPRPACWGRDVFRVIEWRRFEAVVEALFQQTGLQTRSQSHGADGADIWLYSRQQPETPVALVQCKPRSATPVGVDRIRELRGAMAARKVGRGIFATTGTFTADATQFGRQTGIDLLDVEQLLALIAQRSPQQQRALLEVALQGDVR